MQEFTQGNNIASRARWLHTNPEVETFEDDSGVGMKRGHGSCMLSRMAGHSQGVAKSINPIIVRVPRQSVKPTGTTWLNGLRQTLNDIGDGDKKGVVSMSLYFPRTHDFGKFVFKNPDGTDGYEAVRRTMGELLRRLADKGMTLVTGSGNDEAVSLPITSEAEWKRQ
ncbi:hypothetical protein IMZ48_29640 [Candidatus Bathyarchaeota archaeon]|nr:hypothetical protein [Candidatus Bathyarchaeota archaeon]